MSVTAEQGLDLRDRLRIAGQHLDDALLAVNLVRPTPPRDVTKRSLEAARGVLEVLCAQPPARREPQLPPDDGRREPGQQEEDMERRALLKALMAGVTSVPVGALGALERIRERPAGTVRTDEGVVQGLRALVAAYGQAYETVEPSALAPAVGRLLDRITERLHDPMSPAHRQQLGPIAAEAAALAGWLAHLLDHQGAARAYFSLARDAARDAMDDTLHALALGSLSQLHSTTPAGGRGGSPVALRLLEEANARIGRQAPAAARAWLGARLAEERAALGDADGYRRHMARAEDAWTSGVQDEGRGFFSMQGFFAGWDDERFDGYHGVCLLLVERPREAEPYLVRSLQRERARADWRPRATALTDLAAAYAQQREPERACSTAGEALSAATTAGFPMGVQRLRGVRGRLEPWRTHPDVAELDERLATVA
jgi:hypothetical protein